MAEIDVSSVLAQFDRLIADGELFFSPTEPIYVNDGGLKFDFRVVASYKSKPQLSPADDPSGRFATSKSRPPPSDGSDIDHSDPAFFVADINFQSVGADAEERKPTHKLILNKFCAFRPQYILLTQDPLRRQSEPLDASDLSAAWQMLQALTTRHYVIFNGGKEAGSSRVHKHLQVLEEPEGLEVNVVPELRLSYKCFLHRVETKQSHLTVEEQIYTAYADHMKQVRLLLGLSDEDTTTQVAHNVIMTKDWLLTVPRRSGTVEGLAGHIVNAAGMIGQVWLNNNEQLAAWKAIGPSLVLAGLGVPKDVYSGQVPHGGSADEAAKTRDY